MIRLRLVITLVIALVVTAAPPTCPQSPGVPIRIPYALPDGTPLEGVLSLPPNFEAGKKFPTILLIHGGKGVNRSDLHGRAATFLEAQPIQKHLCSAYVVFSAEYYSEYFGDSREFESMAAALRTMRHLPQVDPQRIGAVGVSHGGYLALMCAVHPGINPKPRAAVSVSGVVDVAAFVQHRLRTMPGIKSIQKSDGYATDKVMQALNWPPDKDAQTKDNYTRLSVLSYITNLRIPLLVIHGTGDHLVPVSQARQLRDALQRHHQTFDFVELPTPGIGGHFIFFTRDTVWDKIGSFLGRYL